jgi:CRP-like cAMP-binding protein
VNYEQRAALPAGNHLLQALAPDDMAALGEHLHAVELVRDIVLVQPDEPAEHVWFPDHGLISVTAPDFDGGLVEVATVGRDGTTAVPILLGRETMIFQAMVQIAGAAQRVKASVFRRLVQERPSMREMLQQSILCTLTHMGQSAACIRAHPVNARCARWLLLAHDDAKGDVFELTQEYLSMMLGVSRPSVSVAAAALQRAGLIRYARGRVNIQDRHGLEQAACGCYAKVRDEWDRLLAH